MASILEDDSCDDDEDTFAMRRPSLLDQLKNILREYPEDVQILYVSLNSTQFADQTLNIS